MDRHQPTTQSFVDRERLTHLTLILFEERSGLNRTHEAVTVGIPFPRGKIVHWDRLRLVNQERHLVPLQVQVLNAWPDGSVKWALLDFQATVPASTTTQYELAYVQDPAVCLCHTAGITIERASDTISINTGSSIFIISTREGKLFEQVVVQEIKCLSRYGSRMVLVDEAGREHQPYIHTVAVEAAGPVRATVNMCGCFRADAGATFANFEARLSFYAQSNLVEMKVTLHNPRAARHPGGLWDLGDEGSIYFRDVSLYVALPENEPVVASWKTEVGRPVMERECSRLEIYQASSGGKNWQSTNHVNRFGRVTPQFCGYRVVADGQVLETGARALPTLTIRVEERCVTGTIAGFWQNFPKALEVQEKRLALRLFPAQVGEQYELQGGEQKTHTMFLGFQIGPTFALDWVHDRLLPQLQPEWYTRSQGFRYVSPRQTSARSPRTVDLAEQLVDIAVSGESTFFDRREIIDEYGWRHFGDLYADHEAVGKKGDFPLIAHYNNQYDVVYGALVQYVRSGNPRWFQLADDLARHVIDIDIYHTHEDRSVFNGGLFWHTDHYSDAATATHRSYSKANLGSRNAHEYGGGPSNEHNYTTGLLYYYFLTGDVFAKQAVQSLADWVINLDAGAKNILSLFDRRPSGLCSATVSRDYHGPGRGSGNSINALLDAYSLTQETKYLTKAEELIRRCIHPRDDILARNLADVEHRWSYTVFLQVLGKYLDLKAEFGSLDIMYSYAQESLLHYAQWMVEHETPYSNVLDKVEIPTETWPAQDIRKSIVFLSAAKYSEKPLRSVFLERATFFFEACIHDLLTFSTCQLTRPVVLLMTNAFMYAHVCTHPDGPSPRRREQYAFGRPKRFTPQFYELYKMREKIFACLDGFKNGYRRVMTHFVQTS